MANASYAPPGRRGWPVDRQVGLAYALMGSRTAPKAAIASLQGGARSRVSARRSPVSPSVDDVGPVAMPFNRAACGHAPHEFGR
jgi:hypothetical protein